MQPSLQALPAETATSAVVLVLHGGAENGDDRVRPWSGPYLRMIPFALDLHGAGREHGIAVWQLRNRVRGWNKPELPAVADGRWALARIAERHPNVPIVVVGHSMGARVALRVADDPRVETVIALAPWTTDKDWVSPVSGVSIVIAHGDEDTVTTPKSSLAYAERATDVTNVARFEILRESHAMLARRRIWTRLVRSFTLDALDLPHGEPLVDETWALPQQHRLRLRV